LILSLEEIKHQDGTHGKVIRGERELPREGRVLITEIIAKLKKKRTILFGFCFLILFHYYGPVLTVSV
jgi:hypothetical protein